MNRDILKLPNLLTLFRIVMSAALYLLYIRHFQEPGFISSIFLFIMYVVIALTDLIDGIIARKFDMVTELGKELDPMADKVLVFLMLFAFYRISLLPLWVILPVIARDIFVNYLRKRSKVLEVSFKTSNIAKAKTVVQMIFVGAVLGIPAIMDLPIPDKLYNFFADLVSGPVILITMIIIMIFTVCTGIDYYIKFHRSIREVEE
ncbi:MAG: CDP-alcohol phosphatidyltransferase family protein [Candidatus Marinimicrobia bacterium]|nr:CDP-alcohol phosphatidyltransferase family protein [Candidatus Neomarinimicrobiota bacterium]